jgi:hypothetical protein
MSNPLNAELESEHISNLHNLTENTTISTTPSNKLKNSSILIFLYSLQGLVIGIILETMQMNLKMKFNYSDIGVFLLCSYPFSLKIFWSFLVDTYYLKKIGMRKTWIISTQIIASLILFYLSLSIENLIEEKRIFTLSSMRPRNLKKSY